MVKLRFEEPKECIFSNIYTMTQQLSLFEKIEFSTTRIMAFDDAGCKQYGTGFFYGILVDKGTIPVVLTNKHVLHGMSHAQINFSRADESGNPIYGEPYKLRFDINSGLVFYHPDSSVDLCAIAFQPLLSQMEGANSKLFHQHFDKSLIPTVAQLKELDSVEDIIMIGYPNALWDEVNNIPLVRKGITATPAWIDFNGKKEFVIDAACFPGSSGSPVLLCNIGNVKNKFGGIQFGINRIYLLGLLYGGPQQTIEGEICVKTVPDATRTPYALSSIPNNLGYVIKSERILELSEYILTKIK